MSAPSIPTPAAPTSVAPAESRRLVIARALPGIIMGVYFFFALGDGLLDRLLYGVIGGVLSQGLLMIATLVVVYAVHRIAGASTESDRSMPDFKDLRFTGMLTAIAIMFCLGMYWQHRAERDLVQCLRRRGNISGMSLERTPAGMAESCLEEAAEHARESRGND
jgi:hypothetical protein